MSKSFSFIESGHIYKLGGGVIPSVSSVLNNIYPFKKNPNAEFYMSRGTYIHRCCELILTDELNFDDIPPEIKDDTLPYLHAYMSYLAKEGLKFEKFESEKHRYHKTWKYGFTPDTVWTDLKILDDIKTGGYVRGRYSMQLIAYMEGLKSNGIEIEKMRTVILTPKGYEIRYTRYDKNVFRKFISELKKIKERKNEDKKLGTRH